MYNLESCRDLWLQLVNGDVTVTSQALFNDTSAY